MCMHAGWPKVGSRTVHGQPYVGDPLHGFATPRSQQPGPASIYERKFRPDWAVMSGEWQSREVDPCHISDDP